MKDWPIQKLGEVAIVQMGQSPPGETYNSAGIGLPFFQGKAEFGEEYPTRVKWCSQPSRIAESGDILLSVRAPVGPTNFAKERCCIGRGLAAIRGASSKCNQRYIRYFLKRFETNIAALGVGSTFTAINREDIEHLELPVPPWAIQEKIVRLLDEADELCKLRTQADHRTAEFIPSLFHEMFVASRRCPLKPLQELAVVVSGVAKGRTFKGEKPVTIPYLRVANVQAGYLDLTELKTIEALRKEVEELSLKKGDVLLTEGGDIDKLGRGAMLDRDLPNCIHQNHVFRVRCEESRLLPECFANFLLTQEARHYFRRCAKKTSNLASINMRQLRALPVPVPSLPLQKEFAQRVTEIRELEAAQAASQQRLEALFQSMLHRAFNGEL
jgi:type I restriction enzyme, S subunit